MLPVTNPGPRAIQASGGHTIRLLAWHPPTPPLAVIQIAHGLGEYADRYARFAAAANDKSIAVYCHDHRGHGPDTTSPGYFAVAGGWNAVVDDVHRVRQFIDAECGDVVPVLLGHSMGSYVAQTYVMNHSPRLAGLILSASTWPSRLQLWPAKGLAVMESWRVGAHRPSALLQALGFGKFNKAFRPARTAYDWLSRDAAEVDRYIADPLCGGPFTAGLWRDLVGGLLGVSSDNALLRIASDLPLLISGGSDDPVGGDRGMTRLAMHYAQTGHQRLNVKIYDGGRHEMLNETNRDAVTADWLEWVLATSRNAR